MRTAALLLSLHICTTCFGQGFGHWSVGAHYTGLTYTARKNDARGWNSGYGGSFSMGILRWLSFGVSFNSLYTRETHGPTATIWGISNRQEHHTNTLLASPRILAGKTWERASLHAFVGYEMTMGGHNTVTLSFADQSDKSFTQRSRLFMGTDLGIAATHKLRGNWFAHANASAILFPARTAEPSHFSNAYYDPLDTRAVFLMTVGIAYHFYVD